jgi:hypothetical protein
VFGRVNQDADVLRVAEVLEGLGLGRYWSRIWRRRRRLEMVRGTGVGVERLFKHGWNVLRNRYFGCWHGEIWTSFSLRAG